MSDRDVGLGRIVVTPNVIVLPAAIVATRHVVSLQVLQRARRGWSLRQLLARLFDAIASLFGFSRGDHFVVLAVSGGGSFWIGALKADAARMLVERFAAALYDQSGGNYVIDARRHVTVNRVNADQVSYAIDTAGGDVTINE